MGIDSFTYYRWKRQLDRHGPVACGWASWPGSAKGRIDLPVGAAAVAEILTEVVKGKLIAGPAQDARWPSDRRAAALCRP
jgi:hypothetical protein